MKRDIERERPMKKWIVIAVLITAWILCLPYPSEAQRIYRIGVLLADDWFAPAFDGFKKKMEELGYREGKNLKYGLYNANWDRNLLTEMAARLSQDKPDVIVASSATAAAALATGTRGADIPVVFLSVADPLRFAKSYASSGNNFTGISTSSINLTEKRIELLKELVPKIKRAITLHNSRGPNYETNLHATREAGKRLGLDLAEVTVSSSDELIQRATSLLTQKMGEAVIFPPDPIVTATQKTIYPHVIRERLPSVAASVGNVHAGALATYAADYFALGQQGAMLVNKILKGSRPVDLPIEQPLKLNLVINIKTAKGIGLRIPKEILLRTDEIVE